MLIKDLPGETIIVDHKRKCTVSGCNRIAQNTGHVSTKTNLLQRRRVCQYHHDLTLNNKNRYKKFKKDHCENDDGRLGFICPGMPSDLSVIHLDHNPHNNAATNLMTVCFYCKPSTKKKRKEKTSLEEFFLDN